MDKVLLGKVPSPSISDFSNASHYSDKTLYSFINTYEVCAIGPTSLRGVVTSCLSRVTSLDSE